jgi:hypothetical protein
VRRPIARIGYDGYQRHFTSSKPLVDSYSPNISHPSRDGSSCVGNRLHGDGLETRHACD